jgi:hypothetical protein
MPAWGPETWGDFSVVGFAVFITILMFVAQVRGWIVFGPHHREVVGQKDQTIQQLYIRADKSDESIAKLSEALSKKNGTEDLAAALLAETRKAVGQ